MDNRPLSTPQDEEAEIEWEAFRKVRPDDKACRIYVTDSSEFDIQDTVRYHEWLERNPLGPAQPLALVINMIPNKEKEEELKTRINGIMKLMDVKVGVMIPFIEELFEYSGPLDHMPRLEHAKRLVQALLRKGEENLIIS